MERGPPGPLMNFEADQEVRAPLKEKRSGLGHSTGLQYCVATVLERGVSATKHK